MLPIVFGGSLDAFLDPATGVNVHPRCFGDGQITPRDPNAFAAAAAQAGGEEALVQWLKTWILNHLKRDFAALAEAKGLQNAIRDSSALVQSTTPRINAELAQYGASLEITNLTISLLPEEVNALKAASAKAAEQKRGAASRFAPGTRVIARWTDGREFPATVRGFNGTHYEILWDGAQQTTFVASDCVRLA